MFGKGLTIALSALLLTACHSRHILSEEEYEESSKANIEINLDWRELDEKPTGVTVYFYPTDVEAPDYKVYDYHSNNVDQVKVSLPEQDYSFICFNQTEEEFSGLKFNLSSFEEATVIAMSDEEMDYRPTITPRLTRGYNRTCALTPRNFGCGSQKSVRSSRGYNRTCSLTPNVPAKPLTVSAHVYGLVAGVKISGSLTNLSRGVKLNNLEPLDEKLDQILTPDMWTVKAPTKEGGPSIISTTFGTFGLSNKSKTPTRAGEGEDTGGEVDEQNILTLDFSIGSTDLGSFQIDLTETLYNQKSGVESGKVDGYGATIGSSDDPDADLTTGETYMTGSGSIVIGKTYETEGVNVDAWKDTIINIIVH